MQLIQSIAKKLKIVVDEEFAKNLLMAIADSHDLPESLTEMQFQVIRNLSSSTFALFGIISKKIFFFRTAEKQLNARIDFTASLNLKRLDLEEANKKFFTSETTLFGIELSEAAKKSDPIFHAVPSPIRFPSLSKWKIQISKFQKKRHAEVLERKVSQRRRPMENSGFPQRLPHVQRGV